jgi:hypothetical protein
VRANTWAESNNHGNEGSGSGLDTGDALHFAPPLRATGRCGGRRPAHGTYEHMIDFRAARTRTAAAGITARKLRRIAQGFFAPAR